VVAKHISTGLDIATSCVRAAQLGVKNGEFRLERFGQIPLPVGAVSDGEVQDQAVVGEAIKSLWKNANISGKDVSLGVASQRVVVRQIDIPYIPPKERKTGLPLVVADQIPMPVDEAVLDYVHLGMVSGPDGNQLSRGLLVAASEGIVSSAVEAAEYAGLRVKDVDLTPFALVRALGSTSAAAMAGVSEAIVDVGASTTVLAIHEDGIPHFVRILLQGGQDVTDRLISDLEVNMPTAESIKRETGMSLDSSYTASMDAESIITDVCNNLIDEVRGSLDYFMATSNRPRLERVLLTGGGSLIGGFQEGLQESVGLPVERGMALAALGPGKSGLTVEHVAFADPLSAAAVGLAVRADI